MTFAASPRVVVDPIEIEDDISVRFGVSSTELKGVAEIILDGFSKVSSLHPKGFNGIRGWAEGSAAIRAVLIPKGWHPEDPQNQPRIVSKKLGVAFTVSSGSSFTGIETKTPQTRNDKGSQTSSSVRFNAKQTELFPVTGQVIPLRPQHGDQSLWIFLYYVDRDNKELRYELSQPTAMSEVDKVSEWAVRYVFPPLKFDAVWDSQDDDQDDIPDIDIEVIPKK
ncbi:hypothetical protein PDM28_07735 [Stenotrophomonas aracearum]|jgi:hypothetical protein|uniref:Uncharacterized protein n=1 Tax=Stenotrophomonas aracearum TaxID=3003272 RepID=A0ABY9YIK7_9GAMM|nr:hypothetical protein [Stenotrophomonas sp. A5588]WNH50168.1 hypothetical protein PDM28_07735 [Stenotrophomonas sp. A5588]